MKKKLHNEVWWAVKIQLPYRKLPFFMICHNGDGIFIRTGKKWAQAQCDEQATDPKAVFKAVRVRISELPKKPTDRRGAKKAGKRLATPKDSPTSSRPSSLSSI